jgi:tRNA(Arg) A34 adenosine deaminase TadA
MVAIFLAAHGPEKLKGTTVYTSGESCPMCMGAIVWCGISRVVFGASIPQLATKIGQIMVTDAEIAAKTPLPISRSLAEFWPRRRLRFSNRRNSGSGRGNPRKRGSGRLT